MIINLRGTSGSGKSTVGAALIAKSGAAPIFVAGRKKPHAYRGTLHSRPLYVLGSYETACGGMDTVSSVAEAAEMVNHYAALRGEGVVFYEGLMISHMYGTVGAAVAHHKNHVFAFLTTPLEECLARVSARRVARGASAEFNTANTEKDWGSVQRCKRKIADMGGKIVVDVAHEDAVNTVLRMARARRAKVLGASPVE